MAEVSYLGRLSRWWRGIAVSSVVLVGLVGSLGFGAGRADAATYVRISGAGSTWVANALQQWTRDVQQFGMTIDFASTGSSDGRKQFKFGSVDFAASEIPYGAQDGAIVDPPPDRGFAYLPDVAGGTTFMYNLKIGATRVTNLRLSGPVIAGIFTGKITRWNDAAIARDNPGLALPAIKIVPVVRSDGSGTTAQFSRWMVATQGGAWRAYCARVHRSPCTQTSVYPIVPNSGFVAQSGSLGVAGYVAQPQAVGAITYVEYSYAINAGFPIAKVLNQAGYYTEPTPGHVSVSLLKAKIDTVHKDKARYLTQDLSQVYINRDPRTYPLSSYSYLIVPTTTQPPFTATKGTTLAAFGAYILCVGQSKASAIGYSPLPQNLVKAGFDQLRRIPNAKLPAFRPASCHNPTFSTNGTNTLARTDAFPPACDKKGTVQCTTGTGGAKQSTPGNSGQGGGSSGSGGAASGSGNGGGAAGSGATTSAARAPTSSRAAQPVVCDPDSGACGQGPAAQDTNQTVLGRPVSTSASLGDGLRVTLMALAAALLLGLALAPPLIAQAGRRRRARQVPAPPAEWGPR